MTHQATSFNIDTFLTSGGPASISFAKLWQNIWEQPYLDPSLLELCRLIFARQHGDAVEIAATNPFVENSVENQRLRVETLEDRILDALTLPDGWQSVLRFAEYYWVDVGSIPDELADQVKEEHGDAALVLLIEALGCIDGRIRAARCLRDLFPNLRMQEDRYVI